MTEPSIATKPPAPIDWSALLEPWREILRDHLRLDDDDVCAEAAFSQGPPERHQDNDPYANANANANANAKDDDALCITWRIPRPPMRLFTDPRPFPTEEQLADDRRRHLEALELLDLGWRLDPEGLEMLLSEASDDQRQQPHKRRHNGPIRATRGGAPMRVRMPIAGGIMVIAEDYRYVIEDAILGTGSEPSPAYHAALARIQDEWRRRRRGLTETDAGGFTRTLATRIRLCLDFREANRFRDDREIPWLDRGDLAELQRDFDFELTKKQQREHHKATAAATTPPASPSTEHFCIELTPFVLDAYAMNMRPYPMSDLCIEQVQGIMGQGLGIEDITCGALHFDAQDPTVNAGMIQNITRADYQAGNPKTDAAAADVDPSRDAPSDDQPPRPPPRGATSLTFGEPADAVAWESMCSAIIDSTCLRHLGVIDLRPRRIGWRDNDNPGPTHEDIFDSDGPLPPLPSAWRWLWLAFALFSREARHRLESLALDLATLREADVAVVREMIHAANPRGLLYARALATTKSISDTERAIATDANAPRTLVKVQRDSKIVRFKQSIANRQVPAAEFEDDDADLLYRVLHDNPEEPEVVILYGGVGRCTVARQQLEVVNEPPSCKRPQIRQLRLDITSIAGELGAATSLLELIGGPVERLILATSKPAAEERRSIDSGFLRRVCLACPRLKILKLDWVRLASFEVLSQVYADGSCQATSLALDNVDVDETESLVPFMLALGDRWHPITQYLRCLVWDLHRYQAGLVVDSFCAKALVAECDEMLRSNRTLARLVVQTGTGETQEQLLAIFAEHDGGAIAVRRGPMGPRQTLAFLSVFHTPSTGHRKNEDDRGGSLKKQRRSERPFLTSEQLALILSFAAEHATRVCLATRFDHLK